MHERGSNCHQCMSAPSTGGKCCCDCGVLQGCPIEHGWVEVEVALLGLTALGRAISDNCDRTAG